MYLYIYIYVYMYIRICICIYIYMYVYIHIYKYIHTYIYTHIYIYIYIYGRPAKTYRYKFVVGVFVRYVYKDEMLSVVFARRSLFCIRKKGNYVFLCSQCRKPQTKTNRRRKRLFEKNNSHPVYIKKKTLFL